MSLVGCSTAPQPTILDQSALSSLSSSAIPLLGPSCSNKSRLTDGGHSIPASPGPQLASICVFRMFTSRRRCKGISTRRVAIQGAGPTNGMISSVTTIGHDSTPVKDHVHCLCCTTLHRFHPQDRSCCKEEVGIAWYGPSQKFRRIHALFGFLLSQVSTTGQSLRGVL